MGYPQSCAPRSVHCNFKILKKRPVGNPDLLQIRVKIEVKRPKGCERSFGTHACVIPMMLAMRSIFSLGTHQSFFAELWEAYRLEQANPSNGFVGICPGRSTEAKSVCQKRLQNSHLLVPNPLERSVSKKRLVEAIVTSNARSTMERNTPD